MKPYRPFRFWCQKVLPLVYDNSLSYYELLCKVVDYLNKMGADVALLAQMVTDFQGLDLQDEVNKKLDEMAEDGTLDALLAKYVKNYTKMLLCVSTYREDIRSGSHDYCLAISTDGGLTYSEIRESDDFSGWYLGSDCSIAKVADGYLFMATGASPESNKDMNMSFTKDFVTWYNSEPEYGFLALAQSQCQDTYPMVGTPQIIEDNGKYYLMMSVPTATSSTGENIYGYTETYREMWLYACEVEFDSSAGFTMSKVGNIFPLNVYDRTNIMDGHAVTLNGKLYLFYKDRYDLTVNLAKADSITGTFVDVEKAVFEEVYLEACYMTKISETQALLNCTSYSGRQTTNMLGMFDSETERVVYIGEPVRANCHHFYNNYSRGNTIDCGMRNPNPIVVDSDLYLILKELYKLPTNTPTINKIPFMYTASPLNTLPQRASKYLYDTYGKYMNLFPWVYYYIGSDVNPIYIQNDFNFLMAANMSPEIHFPHATRKISTGVTGERFKAENETIIPYSTLYDQEYVLLDVGLSMRTIRNIYGTTITFLGITTGDIDDADIIATKADFLPAEIWLNIPVFDYDGNSLGVFNVTEGGAVRYHGSGITTGTRLFASGTNVTK